MSIRWSRFNADKWGEGKHARYEITGVSGEYWITFYPGDAAKDVVWGNFNLGWAPTMELAQNRCREVELWLNGRLSQ